VPDHKIRQVEVARLSIVSAKPFDEVIRRIEAAVGRPEMAAFRGQIAAAKTEKELRRAVEDAAGSSGLIEFARFDLGEVLSKEKGKSTRCLRLVIGNPLIMKELVARVPDAGSYAPVTLLIDERADGVHLSYDTMSSVLDSYRNAEAAKIARELDAKVLALLEFAAR